VFKGRAALMLDAIVADQFQGTGTLHHTHNDRAVTEIEILDDISAYQIPLAVVAQVAVFTEHWHHVALLRRILLRMRSW
jgi:hypothetical protein